MTEKVLFNGKLPSARETITNNLLEEIKKYEAPACLLPRPTEILDRGASKDANSGQNFRFMQWNVLAQGLSLVGKFIFCSKEVLNFERRLRYVVLELLRYNADVICLEEVDMFDRLEEYLGPLGYRGTFIPKDPSPCLSFPDNIGPDGCAIFYNSNRLKLMSTTSFQLGNKVSQVALVQLFQSIEDPEITFFMTVTHFKAKKQFSRVRKEQGDVLISKLRETCRKNSMTDTPIFVCCDMNADPDEEAVLTFKSDSDFNFKSVYSLSDASGNEPEFTTWKIRGETDKDLSEVCHTIDYMWYQKSALVSPVSLISMPTKEVIGKNALPCAAFPSDHMSLISDFFIKAGR